MIETTSLPTRSAILSGSEIETIGIVLNANKTHFRSTSYDVSIGSIVVREGHLVREVEGPHVLRPQGVAEVISKETFKLPEDVTAFVSVKTALCDEGVMALNIGLIDPTYEGRLSTTLVNFSNRDYALEHGAVMLRVTFLRCPPTPVLRHPWPSESEYRASKHAKVLRFSETFLNLGASIEEATRPVFWRYAGIAGVLLAGFAFLVNLGLAFAGRNFWSKADVKSDVVRELRDELNTNAGEIRRLRAELDAFEAKAAQQPSSNVRPVPSSEVSSPHPNNRRPAP